MAIDNTNTVLQDFEASLGNKTYCADNIKDGVRLLPKSYAIKRKYVGLNQRLAFYFWVDIDNIRSSVDLLKDGTTGRPISENDTFFDSIEERLESENIPRPTLIIKNKDNNKGHVAWRLDRPVCLTEHGNSAPKEYFKSIQKALAIRLGADLNFTGVHVKNPLSDAYRVTTEDVSYSLDELASVMQHDSTWYVTSKKALNHRKAKTEQLGAGESRNCDLFNITRYWAYQSVGQYDSFENWHKACFDYVVLHNQFTQKLPLKEEKSIAKSIAKWTWKRRHTIECHTYKRPKLALKELKRRQSLAAIRTAEKLKSNTLNRLTAAITTLIGQGVQVTKAAVAQLSQLSYKTVQRYWDRLSQGLTPKQSLRASMMPNPQNTPEKCTFVGSDIPAACMMPSHQVSNQTRSVERFTINPIMQCFNCANDSPIQRQTKKNNNRTFGVAYQVYRRSSPSIKSLQRNANIIGEKPQSLLPQTSGTPLHSASLPVTSLNRHERRYLKRTLDNLIQQHSVVITNRDELMAQCEFALTQDAQFNGIVSFRHRVNILAKLIRERRWTTPKGFYQYCAAGQQIAQARKKAETEHQQRKADITTHDYIKTIITKASRVVATVLTQEALVICHKILALEHKAKIAKNEADRTMMLDWVSELLAQLKSLIQQGADASSIKDILK